MRASIRFCSKIRSEAVRSKTARLIRRGFSRQLLGMPGETDLRIVPDETPQQEFVEVDWQAALSEALVNRPEIASQRASIRSGVGRDFSESAGTVLDNRFQDWTLGFRYERAFWRRFDQATEQQSAILLMQQRAQLKSVEHSVEHELRAAYHELVTASDLVSTLENQLAAAEVQVDANRVLFESGQISLDLFLRTQNAYAETLRQKQQVFVEYTQALAEWEYGKGTIMRSSDVTVTEKMPLEPAWD